MKVVVCGICRLGSERKNDSQKYYIDPHERKNQSILLGKAVCVPIKTAFANDDWHR